MKLIDITATTAAKLAKGDSFTVCNGDKIPNMGTALFLPRGTYIIETVKPQYVLARLSDKKRGGLFLISTGELG